MLLRSYSLFLKVLKTLPVVIASLLGFVAVSVRAADVQPGQQIFCTFVDSKSARDSYKLNARKKFNAYLVNEKRKIPLKFSRVLDAKSLLWSIPANAKTGKYTFKVVKKQNKNGKHYFNCGKAKDYRLTKTPSVTAITQLPGGVLVTNPEGFSNSSAGGSGSSGFVMILNLPPDLTAGVVAYGGFDSSFSDFVAPINYGNLAITVPDYSATIETAGGGALGELDPELCVTKLAENYQDFTTYAAQLDASVSCAGLDSYKTYIANTISVIHSACGDSQNYTVGDNSYSVVETIGVVTQMQADAELIVNGCELPP